MSRSVEDIMIFIVQPWFSRYENNFTVCDNQNYFKELKKFALINSAIPLKCIESTIGYLITVLEMRR